MDLELAASSVLRRSVLRTEQGFKSSVSDTVSGRVAVTEVEGSDLVVMERYVEEGEEEEEDCEGERYIGEEYICDVNDGEEDGVEGERLKLGDGDGDGDGDGHGNGNGRLSLNLNGNMRKESSGSRSGGFSGSNSVSGGGDGGGDGYEKTIGESMMDRQADTYTEDINENGEMSVRNGQHHYHTNTNNLDNLDHGSVSGIYAEESVGSVSTGGLEGVSIESTGMSVQQISLYSAFSRPVPFHMAQPLPHPTPHTTPHTAPRTTAHTAQHTDTHAALSTNLNPVTTNVTTTTTINTISATPIITITATATPAVQASQLPHISPHTATQGNGKVVAVRADIPPPPGCTVEGMRGKNMEGESKGENKGGNQIEGRKDVKEDAKKKMALIGTNTNNGVVLTKNTTGFGEKKNSILRKNDMFTASTVGDKKGEKEVMEIFQGEEEEEEPLDFDHDSGDERERLAHIIMIEQKRQQAQRKCVEKRREHVSATSVESSSVVLDCKGVLSHIGSGKLINIYLYK